MPVLTDIYRYPIKSTHGETLVASTVTSQGLPADRAWMVADASGRMVTGRTDPVLVRVPVVVNRADGPRPASGITSTAPSARATSSVLPANARSSRSFPRDHGCWCTTSFVVTSSTRSEGVPLSPYDLVLSSSAR